MTPATYQRLQQLAKDYSAMTTPIETIHAHIAQSKAREVGVTEGPWDDASKYPEFASVRIFAKTHYVATVGHSDDAKNQTIANAAFIASARTEGPSYRDALALAAEALEFIKEECDWEQFDGESGGDDRIGPTITKVLTAIAARLAEGRVG